MNEVRAGALCAVALRLVDRTADRPQAFSVAARLITVEGEVIRFQSVVKNPEAPQYHLRIEAGLEAEDFAQAATPDEVGSELERLAQNARVIYGGGPAAHAAFSALAPASASAAIDVEELLDLFHPE